METKLKIKVTKEILERSKMCGFIEGEKSIHNCAIALAVRDIFPNANVAGQYIRLNTIGVIKDEDVVDIPKEATEFISLFDAAEPADRPNLTEIEFEITIPDAVLEQIHIEEIKPLLINHPTLELC